MHKPQPKQQIQLHPVQLLQITSQVLGELKTWIETRPEEERSHPEHDMTAAKSLHHARLITNVRLQHLVLEIQKAQEEERKRVVSQMPTQNQLNVAAARVGGQNSAAKTIDDLWKEAGLDHYYNTGRP